jgi:phytoene synthase
VTPESAAFVAAQLRQHDRDRYYATLLLPAGTRPAVAALYAFNADIASVRDRAHDPAAGEIRLQWWADALVGQGHGSVRQNPLAAALLDAISEYGLPVPPLGRMIAARRFDLYQDPMPDTVTFEGYAGETTSALYQLAAMILNGGRPVDTGDAAGHLGVAHALVGHLRAFGYNASQGRIFLPWDVFAVCGVDENDVLAGRQSEGLAIALTRLADMAAEHLGRARTAIAALPRPLRPAFAPVAMLAPQLRRQDFEHPFTSPPDLADWQKIARLGWWKLRNA